MNRYIGYDSRFTNLELRASPFNDRARPGQPTPEDDHQYVISWLDAAAAVRFIKGNGYGSGGCIAVAIEINVKFFERNAQPIGNSLDDA